jgi:N-acyl-D-aspartate/D-glutamate deacylase
LVADGHAEKIWVEGKSLAAIARERGVDPIDAVFDLIIENKGPVRIVPEQHFEDDIRKLVLNPLSMIESDGSIQKYGEGVPHPRSYGVFPLVYRKYVRGETRKEEPKEVGMKILTLQEAVRKMTSFPAQKLGLKDRGLLRENMWADIVIFDPDTITDQATYADPHQYPTGIPYVIVNGEFVVENEKMTGARPGVILRHSK